MDRRSFLCRVATAALAGPAVAQTTSPAQPRIGILTTRSPAERNPINDALIEGLRDHGYVDGRTVVLDYPDAQGREDRLPALAAQLVQRRVDVILVVGPAALKPARDATKTIPLVMVASSADPVADGAARSLARPGGNVTGLTYAEPGRFRKQLELLKAAVPRMRRLGVLWDFDLAEFRRTWQGPLVDAGRTFSTDVLEPERIASVDALPAAFEALKASGADGFLVASGAILLPARERIAALALKHRLPGIGAFRQFAQAGLLMSYGPDFVDINRRAGGFVARILRGTSPATLPIELPSKFDLAINLATAAALGIAVPDALLQRATELIG